MRILNRLKQYQRLYQSTGAHEVTLTVAELAKIFICSERHARTLVQQLQLEGWVRWQSQPGRSKRAVLECLITPEELRKNFLQQLLKSGDHSAALELTQLDSAHLQTLLSPHMGGQWHADSPTLRIPYYRPLETLNPQTITGRAEQHLVHSLFAGLTRFVTGSPEPQPDMAHHWQLSNEGRTWCFFLRSQLHWHNGEDLTAQQLLLTLQQLRDAPRTEACLRNIAQITLPHALCLQFDLHEPDYWLAHRLADFTCLMAHPDNATLGSGPFRLMTFNERLIRLEQHSYYHLQHPYLAAIEYWITPQIFNQSVGVSCQHPVRITLGGKEELPLAQPVSRSTSLGFCYLAINLRRKTLNQQQAQKVIMLIQRSRLLDNLPIDTNLITPSRDMLPGWQIPEQQVDNISLPKKLTLLYHPPLELEAVTQALQHLLAAEGCQLEIIYHPGKLWMGAEQVDTVDLLLGDRLIGEAPEATLENWLRQDPLWQGILPPGAWEHLQSTLLDIQQIEDPLLRSASLQHYFEGLMQNGLITPLFNYQYQVSAPPRVNGVQLTAWGWFDFSQAWIPPPLE